MRSKRRRRASSCRSKRCSRSDGPRVSAEAPSEPQRHPGPADSIATAGDRARQERGQGRAIVQQTPFSGGKHQASQARMQRQRRQTPSQRT